MLEKLRVVRRSVWLWLYLSLLFLALVSFLAAYPIPEFDEKIGGSLIAGYLFLLIFSFGRKISRLIPGFSSLKNSEPWVWKLIYDFGVGLGALGTTVLFLGWALPGSLFVKLTALHVVLILLLIHEALSQKPFFNIQRSAAYSSFFSLFSVLCFGPAFIGMALSLLSCFSPITYYDSLVYHLALPSLYNQTDSIGAVPYNLYSHFPALIEMVFLFIMNQFPFRETIINLMGWGITFLVGLVVASWVKECSSTKASAFSFLLWWTMPAVLLLSHGAYVDIPLSFFTLLAVRSYFHFRKSNLNDHVPFFISGLFSGLACSVKYTGGITAFIIVIFLGWAHLKNIRKGIFYLAFFCGGTLIFFFPWLIKNWISVGNPVFPFLFNIFGGDVGWTESTARGYFQMLTEYGAKSHIFFEMLVAPIRLTKSVLTFGGGFDVLGDFGWNLIFYLLPLGFFCRNQARRTLGVYFLLHFAAWFLSKPVLRFLVGLLPVCVILASLGFWKMSTITNRKTGPVFILIVALFLGSNFVVYAHLVDILKPFDVSLGLKSRQDYLYERLSFYPVFQYTNDHMGTHSKLLILGEQRTYHLEVPFVASHFFSPSVFHFYAKKSASVGEVKNALKSEGFTHLVIHKSEILRNGGLEKLGLTYHDINLLKELLEKGTTSIFEKNGVEIVAL